MLNTLSYLEVYACEFVFLDTEGGREKATGFWAVAGDLELAKAKRAMNQ